MMVPERVADALTLIERRLGVAVAAQRPLDSLSNSAWLVRVGDAYAVLRLHDSLYPAPVTDHAREVRLHELAARHGLAPPVLMADLEHGILLTAFDAAGVLDADDLRQGAALARVADALRALHALPVPDDLRGYSLAQAADVYLRRAGAADDPELLSLAALVRHNESLAEPRIVLCHRDLLHANILATEPAQFIDWEFASPGERWFDLAAVICWHELDAPASDAFVTAYLQRAPAAVERQSLARACASFRALCRLWSLPAA